MSHLPFGRALALMALLLAGCATTTSTAPRRAMPEIVAVETWGGSQASDGAAAAAAAPPQRITRITLHHQGETWVAGRDVADYLRRLQQWSRLSKRWADIPYHYVIAPDGRIYAARPEGISGDTNTAYDPRGHALVMLLGNFELQQPTPAQLHAAVDLMAGLAARHGLTAAAVASHKDYSDQTVCPGANLYRHLRSGWLQRAVAARLAGATLPALPAP